MTDIKTAAHASESGHWYSQGCEQIQEIEGKKPTLRHARVHKWLPGVTSIIGMMASPGLVRWKVKQALLAGFTLPRVEGETGEQWMVRALTDAAAEAKAAAEAGTAIHAMIETQYRAVMVDEMGASRAVLDAGIQLFGPDAFGVWQLLKSTIGEREWVPEKVCVHPSGYGTKSDLHCADWVLDFKGKEFGPDDELETYDEHAMQLAATGQALGIMERAAIVFVSRNNPGLARIVEIEEKKLERGLRMFFACLELWKAKNNYDPSW